MIHYIKIEDPDYGLLIFKVIGVTSQQEARRVIMSNWDKILMNGRTVDGTTTVCPLFDYLKCQESESSSFSS